MLRVPAKDADEHGTAEAAGHQLVRPCLTHGCPALVTKGYCPAHRTTTTERGYGAEWQKVSIAARQAQPWCSICKATTDLTVDHVVPLAQGGQGDVVQVLCRTCNSKKGARASR